MGEAVGTVAEKIGLASGEREQAPFRRRMRFDRAVGADMTKREPAFAERPTDQQTAMAVERLALGTQQTNALTRGCVDHARKPGRKFRPCSHSLVVGNTIAIKAGSRGRPASAS